MLKFYSALYGFRGAGHYHVRAETFAARIAVLTLIETLFVVFTIVGTRRPSAANVVLFVAASIAGLVRW